FGRGAAGLAWIGHSSNASRLFLQYIDARGKFGWGPQGMNLSYGSWDEWNPKIRGNGEGSMLVGWEDFRNKLHWQVFLAKVDHAGTSPWPVTEIALAHINADQGHLAFVDDGNHGVFAVWTDNRTGAVGI